jgi:tetratricopeptide (TPR) repeat protein
MEKLIFVSQRLVFAAALILLERPAAADYKQAVAYYMRSQFDKAIQELKPDLEANPDWEPGHRLVGLCYLNLRNNALAVSSLTRAVQLKSTSSSTYYGLGQAYFNMQKYDYCVLALDQGEPFIKNEKPSDQEMQRHRFYHLKGSAEYRLGKFNEAINDLAAAIRTDQSDWTDFSELGFSYYNLNRPDEAIQSLQKAASMKPGQAVVTEYIGKSYFKKGVDALKAKNYPQAIDALTKAKEINPSDGYISYNLAEAYLFQKRYPEAEKALIQAVTAMPKSADVYMRMGLVFEKQKKWDMALNSYKKANEIKPSYGLKDIERVNQAKKP